MIDVMEAPEGVRREAVPNSVCVQFYGPSASKGRDRDYCWATAEQLAPFGLNLALLEQQNIPKRMRPTAYREALVEARALYEEHGNNVSAVVAFDPEEAAADAAAADDLGDADAPRCSSCSLALDAPGVSGTASYPRQTPLASAVDAAPRAPTTRRAIRDVTARSIVAESRKGARRRGDARRCDAPHTSAPRVARDDARRRRVSRFQTFLMFDASSCFCPGESREIGTPPSFA